MVKEADSLAGPEMRELDQSLWEEARICDQNELRCVARLLDVNGLAAVVDRTLEWEVEVDKMLL